MILKEKWEKFARNLAAEYLRSGLTSDCITFLSFQRSVQRAFYAGVEFGLQPEAIEDIKEIQAEIDRFKGQK